jgi:hypothetical protein
MYYAWEEQEMQVFIFLNLERYLGIGVSNTEKNNCREMSGSG